LLRALLVIGERLRQQALRTEDRLHVEAIGHHA
jgi:hypothetical protein